MERSPDDQLVDAVRQGVQAAVEVLFDRYHEPMLSFCRHMLGRHEDAEDAVRAGFEQAVRVVRRHDRPVHIKPLLFTIARNRCVAALESRPRSDARMDLRGLDPEVARDAELQLLAADVGRLPLDQRAVLLLRELETHTREEIAAIAGCPADKADALLAEARTALTGTDEPDDWACAHVRPLLAASGGAPPPREAMRRHVTTCESCIAFNAALARQRRYLPIILAVTPTAGLVAPALAPAPRAVPDAPERPRRIGLKRRRP